MKTKLFLFAAIFCVSFNSYATTDTVTVQNHVFTPSSISSVPLGDTIMWIWLNGTHTTTSTSIPAGAATWNNNMNSTSTTFIYVPTVAGTYNYQCNIHVSMGMIGSFTVVGGTGINGTAAVPITAISPNPVSQTLHIQFRSTAPMTITMTDMAGKKTIVKKFSGKKSADINVADVPAGNYIFHAEQGTEVFNQQIVVKH